MGKGAGEKTIPENEAISALGGRLTAKRKERGVSREAASREAGIPVRYLDMLEDGRFPTVSDPAYLTHFLRRYAAYLGLDPQETARLFLEETEPETRARQSGRPRSGKPDASAPAGAATPPPKAATPPKPGATPPPKAATPPSASDRPAKSPAPAVSRPAAKRPAAPNPPGRRRSLPPGWAIYGIIVVVGLGGLFAVARMQQAREPAFPEISTSAEPSSSSSGVQVASADDSGPVVVPDWGTEPGPKFDPEKLAAPKVQPYESRRTGSDEPPAEEPVVDEPARVASAPEASSAGSGTPEEATVDEPGSPAAVEEKTVAPDAASGAEEPAASEPVEVAEAPEAQEPAPSVSGGSHGVEPPYELRITATSRQVWVWVSIDGGPQEAVSLERGDSAQFTAREGYVLTVDDAGGVTATLNGEELPSFGPRQQVRRNVVVPSNEFSPGA